VIAFPRGCAYRRVLERWVGDKDLASAAVLSSARTTRSWHALRRHRRCDRASVRAGDRPEQSGRDLPTAKGIERRVTPLIWRFGENAPPVNALRELIGTVAAARGLARVRLVAGT
jgi:hypothetical protein